jgi:hypothetical protein
LFPPLLFELSLYLVTFVSKVAVGCWNYEPLKRFDPIGAIGFFCCRLVLLAPPPIFDEVPEVEAADENPAPPPPKPE